MEIESTFLRLKISQLKKGKITDIENLEYPLHIGTDLYSEGKIGFDSLRELSKTLRGYGKVLEGYGIESCPAAVGSELLAAGNYFFLMDRLNFPGGPIPEQYGAGRENALVCYEIMKALSGREIPSGCAAVARIGAGCVGLTVFSEERAVYTRTFPAGSLKLCRTFSEIRDTFDLSCAAEDYLDELFAGLALPLPEGAKPVLILAGYEMRPAAELCGSADDAGRRTKPEKLLELYGRIRGFTADKIGMKLDLTEEAAKRLYFTLAVTRSLIRTVSPGSVLLPETGLADALIRRALLPKEQNGFQVHVREGAVACARTIAYGCGLEHAEAVRKTSCRIFDKLQKEYGLGKETKLLLELAAVLRECGRSAVNGEIYGITEKEAGIVASLALNHGANEGGPPQNETELTVLRLSAILELAVSLNRSGRRKLGGIRIKMEKSSLKIQAETTEEAALEKWAFQRCVPRFAEAFGLTPELTIQFTEHPK